MSQRVMDELRRLVQERDWQAVVNLECSVIEPAADRAKAHYMWSHARWNLGRDANDYAKAVRHAHEAYRLDPDNGKALHWLAGRLITIGRFAEGRKLMLRWISRLQQWQPRVQAYLGDAQYALGYAARYERNFSQAYCWYQAALETFRQTGNTQWAGLTLCSAARVLARLGSVAQAQELLDTGAATASSGQVLAAQCVIFSQAGDLDACLRTGEQAVWALTIDDDSDPWEVAEVHLTVADAAERAGDPTCTKLHLEAAVVAMSASPRHDLYAIASLLLENDHREVV